jgi:beta-glucosidase
MYLKDEPHFELPSSMQSVLDQKEDLPYDSENPLFEFGHGLKYTKINE